LTDILLDIYRKLLDHFGHLDWWPGDTAFEIIVGAILTQNTAWSNVERAISNLKDARALEPERMLTLQTGQLAKLIKPSGYYNQKAGRLKSICRYLIDRHEADFDEMAGRPTGTLREELLAINGIGPETADSILLYALEHPVFVVDAYTKRALGRIGLSGGKNSYQEIQRLFMDNLPEDTALFNDYHAQWVALGKYHCKTKPVCKGCPLREICRYAESYRLQNPPVPQ